MQTQQVIASNTAIAAPDYPLARTEAEHRRLAAQAEFWAPDAQTLFAAAGIAPGMAAADLGCGTLHVARSLAQRVGGGGRVFALDSDALLVEANRHDAADAGIALTHGDAYAAPWADGTLDAVHARFVAAPCGRPAALIDEMLRLLRPGGVLALQEPASDSWRIAGAGAAWPRLHELIREGFRRRGGDFDAGRALLERLTPHLSGLHVREVTYTLPATHPYAALPLQFSSSLEALWLREGLIAGGELAALRLAVADALARPGACVRTFTLVQVWGRKRGHA